MNTKTTYFVVLLFTLVSTFSHSKDKKTLIEQIEQADSIPVFLILGAVTPGEYNYQTVFPLSARESTMKRVNGTFPKESDSLHPTIVEKLNAKFNTTKFYATQCGSEEDFRKKVVAEKIEFFVFAEFASDYMYRLAASHRDEKGNLISILDMWVRCNVAFFQLTEDKQPIDHICRVIGAQFVGVATKKYTPDANDLIMLNSPLTLANKTLAHLDEKLTEFVEKQREKHEKAKLKED